MLWQVRVSVGVPFELLAIPSDAVGGYSEARMADMALTTDNLMEIVEALKNSKTDSACHHVQFLWNCHCGCCGCGARVR